mmetsp:Transcript_12294/g.23877  ORF Transcript_12294/g.23877 Transcript_12294/m.23877 type:complete len:104 (-) Transcript_12294:49-360(-)
MASPAWPWPMPELEGSPTAAPPATGPGRPAEICDKERLAFIGSLALVAFIFLKMVGVVDFVTNIHLDAIEDLATPAQKAAMAGDTTAIGGGCCLRRSRHPKAQ